MVIPGEGGIGKLEVIQTVTQSFKQQNVSDWLVKGAYTGITALFRVIETVNTELRQRNVKKMGQLAKVA
jgi:hypothetical protein